MCGWEGAYDLGSDGGGREGGGCLCALRGGLAACGRAQVTQQSRLWVRSLWPRSCPPVDRPTLATPGGRRQRGHAAAPDTRDAMSSRLTCGPRLSELRGTEAGERLPVRGVRRAPGEKTSHQVAAGRPRRPRIRKEAFRVGCRCEIRLFRGPIARSCRGCHSLNIGNLCAALPKTAAPGRARTL